MCQIEAPFKPKPAIRTPCDAQISKTPKISADYADLIFTLATDTHGPTLTFSSADNGRGKTVNRYAIIKTIEPLDLLASHNKRYVCVGLCGSVAN